MSALRVIGVFVAGAVGFGIGVYAGLYAYLAATGLEDGPWQYLAVTWGGGCMVAGAAAALAAPATARLWRTVMLAAVAVALAGFVLLAVFDGGYDQVIFGGFAAVAVLTATASTRSGAAPDRT